MSTPASLGDSAFAVTRVKPFSTSTALIFIRTSDTGTVATNGTQVDLGALMHVGSTGGKPLDSTVHRRAGGPPRYKSAKLSVGFEAAFHTSGLNLYFTVAHQNRSATSGAGSTWAAIKTDVFRYKMGTDTDAVFIDGFASSANLQAAKRYYRAVLTTSFKKASSTAVADTTTGIGPIFINSALYEFSGGDQPQVSVPYKVS